MKLDANKYYRMPLLMGPLFDRARPRFAYPEVECLAYQYLADPGAIAALVPDCYLPGKEPLVTVAFVHNNGLRFMAGGGYRLATVQVSARFHGELDDVEGDLILVMFENHTWPILGGREDLGVPKLYADIANFKALPDGTTRCEASLWGHLLFRLDVQGLRAQPGVVRAVAARRLNARPWLGYKYIPSLDGPPDAEYPTMSKNDTKLERLWLGKRAKVQFGDVGRDDIDAVKPLLDALATLEVVKPVQALRFRGSAVLRYDLSRRLK